MSNFLGVKYIGKKPRKEDTIFKTNAVWTHGQIINFDAGMALELAKHTDTFELADVQPGVGLYEAPKKSTVQQQSKEPIGYFNVETMDAEALNVFSMRHFGRSIDQTKTIEQIREEVIGLARVEAVFDDELHVEVGEDNHFIALLVNNEEYAAFKAGIAILKLVPKPAVGEDTGGFVESSTYVIPKEQKPEFKVISSGGGDAGDANSVGGGGAGLDTLQKPAEAPAANDSDETGDDNAPTREKLDAALAAIPTDHADVEALINQLRDQFGGFFTAADEIKVRDSINPVEKKDPRADPTAELKANLEKLDTKALRDMVKEAGLPVSNTMKKEMLIEKLMAAAAEEGK